MSDIKIMKTEKAFRKFSQRRRQCSLGGYIDIKVAGRGHHHDHDDDKREVICKPALVMNLL